MPVPELAQKQVGVMTRIVDVVDDGRATDFAGVVDHQIAEPQDSLGD